MKELGKKLGKTSIELVKILKPTHWALQHIPVFFNENGDLKESNNRGFDVIIGNPPYNKNFNDILVASDGCQIRRVRF